ncbi:MAG: hypothetical protein P4L27_00620, partial [Ignavibacteriaceae bacterium]|nr:hypothetical protein [Ignavibacteriaceae bacterium]
MKKTCTFLAVLLFSVMLFSTANATGLLTEDFSYTAGAVLTTATTNWTAHSGTGGIFVSSTGLSYPGLTGSGVGNAVTVNGVTTEDDNRLLSSIVTTGSVYASAMINVTSVTSTAGDYFFHFGKGTSTFLGKVMVRKNATSGYDFGVSKVANATGVAVWTPAGSPYTLGTTYLVVLKYMFVAGATNDSCFLYINPTPGGSEPVPTLATTDGNTGTDADTIKAIFMRQSSASLMPVAMIDGIKVGTTWGDVTPLSGGASLTCNSTMVPFAQTSASATASQSYTIKGTNLTQTVTVTPPAGFEISTDNASWVANPSSVTVSAANANAGYTLYARMHAGTIGGYSVDIAHSSAELGTVNQHVTGTYTLIYYSASSGNLDVLGTWGLNTDGSGANPSSFATGGQVYKVQNRSAATVGGTWTIANISTGSKVIIGDGTNACNVTIPSGSPVSGTIDVSAGATLTWGDATAPALGLLNATSTVNYNQSGTFTVPTTPTIYGNITLTNGTKFLGATSYTVAGNVTFDGATGCNGSGSPFTTVNLKGNWTQTNGATFDTANGNRLTLNCNGTSAQTLSGGGNEIILFRVIVDNAAGVVLSSSTGSNLTVGNLSGGGFQFITTGNFINVNNNKVTVYAGKSNIIGTGTFTAGANAEFTFQNISSSTNAIGTFALTTGSQTIKNLTVNLKSATATPVNYVTLGSPITVTGTLTLTAGFINTPNAAPADFITLGSAANIVGGSATSYIEGPLALTAAASGVNSLFFPVGSFVTPTNIYRPVTLGVTQSTATATTYKVVETEGSDPSVSTLPSSLASRSAIRFYTITKGAGATVTAANINLSYGSDDGVSNASLCRIARDNGATWDNLGGVGSAPTTGNITSTVNFTGFGDFVLATAPAAQVLTLTALVEALYVAGGTAMSITPDVTVELHNATSPYALVESKTATLSTAGVGTFNFTTAVGGTNYYIVVKSMNTVETWSATAVSFTSNALSYDFTTALNKAYTDGSADPMSLHGGKYCIYSGDLNQDGFVSGDDMTGIDNDNTNFDYHAVNDLNGDGFISGDD